MLIDDAGLDNFINEKLIKTYHFAKNIYVNTNTNSALEFLNNLATVSEEFPQIYPEVIFIDINMPIVDGFQFINSFTQTIEKQAKKPKLVILTSSVAETDREKTANISTEIIFLNKPLNKKMLDLL